MVKNLQGLVILSFSVLLLSLTIHAVPPDANSAIDEASRAGQFLFLAFYETKDASFTTMSSTTSAFKKTSAIKISTFDVKVSDPANKDVVTRYGIQTVQLPLLLVIAPNGVVTGGYPANVSADQLKQSVGTSDLMLKVLKPLQEQKVTLVALQNATTKLNVESWAGVTEFINDANYKQHVSAIKADPATAGGQEFVKQCQIIGPITEATVVVLLPPGRIGKILTGKLTKADILKSLQSCTAGSGCCSDHRFKENITPIVSALEKVTKLQGITFTWNLKEYPSRFFTDALQVGVIAQDVEAVIPELVHTDKDGFKSVEYDKLTAVLIEAVKEINRKIAMQDSLINEQNVRIKALEGK